MWFFSIIAIEGPAPYLQTNKLYLNPLHILLCNGSKQNQHERGKSQSHKGTHSSNEKDPAIISDHSWLGWQLSFSYLIFHCYTPGCRMIMWFTEEKLFCWSKRFSTDEIFGTCTCKRDSLFSFPLLFSSYPIFLPHLLDLNIFSIIFSS